MKRCTFFSPRLTGLFWVQIFLTVQPWKKKKIRDKWKLLCCVNTQICHDHLSMTIWLLGLTDQVPRMSQAWLQCERRVSVCVNSSVRWYVSVYLGWTGSQIPWKETVFLLSYISGSLPDCHPNAAPPDPIRQAERGSHPAVCYDYCCLTIV